MQRWTQNKPFRQTGRRRIRTVVTFTLEKFMAFNGKFVSEYKTRPFLRRSLLLDAAVAARVLPPGHRGDEPLHHLHDISCCAAQKDHATSYRPTTSSLDLGESAGKARERPGEATQARGGSQRCIGLRGLQREVRGRLTYARLTFVRESVVYSSCA